VLPRFISSFLTLPSGIRQMTTSLKNVLTYVDGSRPITGNGAMNSDMYRHPRRCANATPADHAVIGQATGDKEIVRRTTNERSQSQNIR
jgi:hypothetical protein